MHSFQPSRGRIFFDFLCALTVSASLAGGWFQTGATALLPGAAAALFCGLVRLFDMRRRARVAPDEPQRIEFEPEAQPEAPARQDAVVPFAVAEPSPIEPLVAPSVAEEVAPRTGAGRRKGGARKSSGRRSKAVEQPVLVEAVPQVTAEHHEEEPLADHTPVAPDAADRMEDFDESFHPPVAPLFEPEPYVRHQQRAVFGRKAG